MPDHYYNVAMTESVLLQPVECARLAVDVVSERQASDIVLLDIRDASDFADYFVIVTAESARQMRTLAEEMESSLERTGATLHHREGTPHSGWMLLDFGDVLVHLFGPEEREFYQIEGVWAPGAGSRQDSVVHLSLFQGYSSISSGVKNRSTSLLASASESEPWIKLRPMDSARSPRIVPGAAF